MKQKLVSVLFIVLGIVTLLYAIIVTSVANMNFGTICVYILATALTAFGILYGKLPVWFRITLPALIAACLICVGVLLIGGSIDNVTYSEDALIVLGAGIRGDRPSQTLRLRLDSAVRFHENNPNALIVVSGGQGRNEIVSEAYAMEKYLVSQGVDPNVIIKEELSTSTKENFAFSKELLDARLGSEYSVAYVTNSFHIYRAGRYAHGAGLNSVTHLHGATHPLTALSDGMRECLAIIKLWILG